MNNEDLIIKWLDGKLSAAELKAFQQQPEYASYEKIYNAATYFKAPKINTLEQYTNFKLKLAKENTATKSITLPKILFRIAAIFIVGFGLYFTLLYENLNKVNSLASEHKIITLPDNSQVTLNAVSTIKYNEKSWDKKRKLTLEGEAFFNVAKGATFKVKTEIGTVSVLGTQFNVNQRGNLFEVQCFEGVVNVEINSKNVKLHKGETIRLFEKKWLKGKTSLTKPTWVNGISSFISIPYYEVLAEFERQLGVTIALENVAIEKLFTGSFVHNNAELALKSITQPFKLSYNITNKNVKIFKHE